MLAISVVICVFSEGKTLTIWQHEPKTLSSVGLPLNITAEVLC